MTYVRLGPDDDGTIEAALDAYMTADTPEARQVADREARRRCDRLADAMRDFSAALRPT